MGPRGRLQIIRGAESITFQPNTLAAVFTRARDQNQRTEVVQQIGEITLQIEKRQQPPTTVQTPFLAAVMKGTRFTVKVEKADAVVSVDRGLVQVRSFQSGERSDLGPGQSAPAATSGMSVAGLSKTPTVTRVAPSDPFISALDATGIARANKADKFSGKASSHASTKAGSASTSKGAGNGNAGGNGNGNGNSGEKSGGKGSGNAGGNGDAGGNGGGKGSPNGEGRERNR